LFVILGKVTTMHSSLTHEHRKAVTTQFKTGELHVTFGTAANEMGVHNANLEEAFGWKSFTSVESYDQRDGRIGRANQNCVFTMFYDPVRMSNDRAPKTTTQLSESEAKQATKTQYYKDLARFGYIVI